MATLLILERGLLSETGSTVFLVLDSHQFVEIPYAAVGERFPAI